MREGSAEEEGTTNSGECRVRVRANERRLDLERRKVGSEGGFGGRME